jgi:hypothetical protein
LVSVDSDALSAFIDDVSRETIAIPPVSTSTPARAIRRTFQGDLGGFFACCM